MLGQCGRPFAPSAAARSIAPSRRQRGVIAAGDLDDLEILVGETFADAAAACHIRFGAVLTRERETLPARFPFKRHGDDGEWKDEHGQHFEGPEAK